MATEAKAPLCRPQRRPACRGAQGERLLEFHSSIQWRGDDPARSELDNVVQELSRRSWHFFGADLHPTGGGTISTNALAGTRSEEHTAGLPSPCNLVFRLL